MRLEVKAWVTTFPLLSQTVTIVSKEAGKQSMSLYLPLLTGGPEVQGSEMIRSDQVAAR